MTPTTAQSSSAADAVIGIDIGGTKIAAGLVLPDGLIESELTAATPADAGPDAVLDLVADLVAEIRQRAGAAGAPAPTAVGIGSAGVIDPHSGGVLAATDHIAGWAGTPLAPRLELRTGLPTSAINDVHAHALGEARFGAGRGLELVLVVAVGTGLAGSVVRHGVPLIGAHGAAGHLGHVPADAARGLPCSCGGTGHLEAISSGPGLVDLYRRHGGVADDARRVVAAAAADPLARDCVTTAGRALGRALGGWVNLLDPDAVIITGGLARAGETWWRAVTDAAQDEFIPAVRGCRILPSGIGPRAAILGAAAYADDRARLAVPAGTGAGR